MKRTHTFFLLAGVSALALTGCSGFQQDTKTIDNAATQAQAASSNLPQPVTDVAAPYLLGAQMQVAATPSPLLDLPVTLIDAQPATIQEIASQITGVTGVPVQIGNLGTASLSTPAMSQYGALPPPPASFFGGVSSGASTIPQITMQFHGNLGGLLSEIDAKAGVSSKIKDGEVEFYKVETKTFEIPAFSRKAYDSGLISADTGGAAGGSGATGSSLSYNGAGSNGGSGTDSGGQDGSASISSSATIDVWSGLQKIAATIGDGAQVVADPNTGTLTVTGTPDQLSAVSEWCHCVEAPGIASILSKNISVTEDIYEVDMSDENNFGVNPALAFENAAKNVGVSLTGVGVPTVATGETPMSFTSSILSTAQGTSGQFAGTSAAIQALATLGHVTQVFQRTFTTLNGQPSPIQVGEQITYLAESESTSTANVGVSNGLLPGYLTTGLTNTVTPRIYGNQVLLDLKMRVSSIVSLNSASSGGSSIGTPITAISGNDQEVSIPSGSTMMVSGYNEEDGNSTQNGVGSPGFWGLGGGHDTQIKNDMIVVVVTARIL
jgi:type IVB pilus formation R64 PilN family outer membrane protein